MPRFKIVDDKRIQLTEAEEAARDAEEAQAVLDAVARKEAEDAKKARIESAKTKLQDLGLTLDEVKDAFNI